MDKPSEMEEESEKGTSSTPTVDEMYHQMYEERSRIKKNDQSLFSDALLSRIKLLSVLSYVICDIQLIVSIHSTEEPDNEEGKDETSDEGDEYDPSSGTWDVETDDITSCLSNNDSGHETEVDDDMEMESGNKSDDDMEMESGNKSDDDMEMESGNESDDDMEMESGNESDDDRNTDPLDLSNHEPSLNSRVDEMTHYNGEMIVNHQRTSFRRNSQQIQLVEIIY